jgi:hypothetical protein
LTPEVAARSLDELGAIRRVVDGMLGKAAKRVSETSSSVDDAVASVAQTLGVSRSEVRGVIGTAARLESLPATDRAVREGRLSAVEAQLISGAAKRNPEAETDLLQTVSRGLTHLRDACVAARAAVEDPDTRAKRQHRDRELRCWTDRDGMLAGRFRYAPEVGAQLKAVIDAQANRIFREHKAGTDHEPLEAYAADALASLILSEATDRPGKVDAVVNIVVDHGALVRGGTADGEVCEIPGVGPVDVSWVKELLDSAFLTVVIKKGKDIRTVAHLGRHVPAEVMTALIVSGRECDVEGCDCRGYLERDHVQDHARGGLTSFENLGWLCYRHHRLKSRGWILGSRNPITGKRALRPPQARAA